jgi:SAM-dependent methyltransferase
LKLVEAADLVTWTFDSLNYLLSIAEIGRVFNNVAEHLKPDGRFLFDVNTPYKYEDRQLGTIHRSVDGYEFDQVLSYDRKRRISTTIFDFDDGMREVHNQMLYTYNEIEVTLRDNGLMILRSFENSELSPATPQSSRILFLAGRTKVGREIHNKSLE